MKEITVGSISHGTLRNQDMIPTFLEYMNKHDMPEYEQLIVNGEGIPAYVFDEGDESEWWDSQAGIDLFEELFCLLDMYAPDGYYFGAHEGDGSDFGYWEIPE